MSDFDDIVAGIDIDVESAERENSILKTGEAFFRTIAPETRDDPELIFLIVSSLWISHFLGLDSTTQLWAADMDAFERVYVQLKEAA